HPTEISSSMRDTGMVRRGGGAPSASVVVAGTSVKGLAHTIGEGGLRRFLGVLGSQRAHRDWGCVLRVKRTHSQDENDRCGSSCTGRLKIGAFSEGPAAGATRKVLPISSVRRAVRAGPGDHGCATGSILSRSRIRLSLTRGNEA